MKNFNLKKFLQIFSKTLLVNTVTSGNGQLVGDFILAALVFWLYLSMS